jgi:ribosomal protein L40E
MKMSMVEKKKRVKRIRTEICKKCQAKLGMGTEDPCFKCYWKELMDEILDY